VHPLVALALIAAAFAAPAAASTAPIAFGRTGGNIRPLTVTIARDGTITARDAQGLRPRLSPDAVAGLLKLAAAERFSALPASVRCTGTNPDVAAGWIRVGQKTISVRGGCRPAFTQLYSVLSAAVGLPG